MADEGDDTRPAIRIGDAERRAVDERLQRAHGEGRLTLTEYEERAAKVWAARTEADLDGLTSDLPAAASAPAAVAKTEPVAVEREAGAPSWVHRAGGVLGALVLGAAVVWGGAQVISREDGATVFSGRTIGVAPDDDRVEVGVLFGRVDVVVPDGVRVDQRSFMVFGSVDCDAACVGPGPRVITVDTAGSFASVDILTESEAAAEAAEDAAEDAEDADDDD